MIGPFVLLVVPTLIFGFLSWLGPMVDCFIGVVAWIAIFYSGEHGAHVLIAKMIGDYWERVITNGWGDYRNSNADKDRMTYRWGVGIGQVNRYGHPRRDASRLSVENYMARANQVQRDRDEEDKLFCVRRFDRKHRP